MSQEDNEGGEKPDKKLVGVRIEEDRHKEWKDFVNESNEFSSIAQMIRVGVESVMSDESESIQETLEMLRDELEELREEQKRTRHHVEDLPNQLDDAEIVAEEVIYRLDELRDADVRSHGDQDEV
jgi:dihydroorotate dehydrogenase